MQSSASAFFSYHSMAEPLAEGWMAEDGTDLSEEAAICGTAATVDEELGILAPLTAKAHANPEMALRKYEDRVQAPGDTWGSKVY